jgi:hypothetical protein
MRFIKHILGEKESNLSTTHIFFSLVNASAHFGSAPTVLIKIQRREKMFWLRTPISAVRFSAEAITRQMYKQHARCTKQNSDLRCLGTKCVTNTPHGAHLYKRFVELRARESKAI